ncbi:MAG: outer rane efflux protein [Gemmatimonadetes bacterium]|nr:outer rane efflux protein [Gemmatimonadota bacterium]
MIQYRQLSLLALLAALPAGAQLPVTRAEAERAALSAGTRVALARADTAAALARALTARALPNPTLAASYSKATPQKHITVDIPIFDALRTRSIRGGQASASVRAARLLFSSERAAAFVEVDTTYTRALAAQARYRLSLQTARDADSLRIMTVARRDAGDASDLDVDLATVVAGQQINVAASDSLSYMSALLTVQTLMGIPADSVAIVLADSLAVVQRDTTALRDSVRTAPSILAAQATLEAAELGISVQKGSVFALPSLSIGVEFGDPTGGEPGMLPLIGLSVPLPLFSRNQGPIAEAMAERERARVLLTAARLEVRQRIVEGTRERDVLIARIARDRDLVVRADRVATRSLTAYREGASALPAVLEARRSAREVLGQYIDDVAALLTVNTELRALTQTAPAP